MDPVLIAALVESAVKLAGDVSTMALQSGTMTADEVQALWDKQRTSWAADWAMWLAQNAGSPT